MEHIGNQEVHKNKIRYYLDGMTQKIVELELSRNTLTDEQVRGIEHEILAMDMSLKSNLAGKSLAEAGIEEEYESLMRTKERLLGIEEMQEAA